MKGNDIGRYFACTAQVAKPCNYIMNQNDHAGWSECIFS